MISADTATPAQVGKLRGVLGFLATAYYGQVGRGGAHALLRRQYSDKPPWGLSNMLRRALQYYDQLQSMDLRREVAVWSRYEAPVVIASDARRDSSAPPSVGVLIHDLRTGAKVAHAGYVGPDLLRLWGDEETIAAAEQAAVVMGLVCRSRMLHQRRVIWFIDNSVVLSAMCRGTSHGPALDEASLVVQLMVAQIRARIWWEYVESEANWSVQLSREVASTPWMRKMGFQYEPATVPIQPWVQEPHTRLRRVAALTGTALGKWSGVGGGTPGGKGSGQGARYDPIPRGRGLTLDYLPNAVRVRSGTVADMNGKAD